MRNFSFCGYKWDKKFFFAFLVAVVCSIICGIVLYKPVISNIYLRNLVYDYVYNVFNFKNSALIFPHLLVGLIYLYAAFLLAYFTKFKYLTLIFVFLRGLFFGIYIAIIMSANSFGGVVVGLIVYIPSSLVSFALCYLVVEFCKLCDGNIAFILPAAAAVLDTLIFIILLNLVFRAVIAIV